jgi:CDGSH-type Zn-finger protein/uncharacterized Fe-S cluster protein YjdI
LVNEQTNLAVNDREELIYLLTEAAEFEHTVMCTYLYAQWSLKREEGEGVTRREMEAIERWRRLLGKIALEEMLHLALVNNLLASIGAAPHLSRPEFPVGSGHFPAAIDFHLAPFNEQTIRHFMFIERPEGIDIEDGAGFVHESRYSRPVCPGLLTPTPRDYHSVGHLYHGIAQAMRRLAQRFGERRLFAGHGEAQLGPAEFPLPGLFPVTDLASAMRAIEEIVLQGEGSPAHRDNSHYAHFAAILDEYVALQADRPDFEPAHPAAVNPLLTESAHGPKVNRISNPRSRYVVDLGNSMYALMVHLLAQVCAPVPLPAGLRRGLSDAAAQLMQWTRVVGEAAARLPIGDATQKMHAGLSFCLPRSFGQLVPANAGLILAERAAELSLAARSLQERVQLPGVADGLNEISASLVRLHAGYESRISGAPAATASAAREGAVPEQAAQAHAEANSASTEKITLRFDAARCIHSRRCVLAAPRVFVTGASGQWLHPENDTVERLVQVAQSCPSGAITYQRCDGGPQEAAPEVNTIGILENGPYAVHAELQVDGQGAMYRAALCRCGKSGNKPFCDGSHRSSGFQASGEPPAVEAPPSQERGGPLAVSPAANGPLRLSGAVEICTGTGRRVTCTRQAALCRCGASANKPFCDGSHLRIGFKTAPQR